MHGLASLLKGWQGHSEIVVIVMVFLCFGSYIPAGAQEVEVIEPQSVNQDEGGTFHMRLWTEELKKIDQRLRNALLSFPLTLWREGDEKPYYRKNHGMPLGSIYLLPHVRVKLPPGEWTAQISTDTFGVAERRFTIDKGTRFELKLHDLYETKSPGLVDVKGVLHQHDACDSRFWLIRLTGNDFRFTEEVKHEFNAFAQNNEFTFENILPGSWSVTVINERCFKTHLREKIQLHHNCPMPVHCELEIPKGRVTGIFKDRRTQDTIEKSGEKSTIQIFDAFTNEPVAEYSRNSTYPEFDFFGLTGGSYYLQAHVIPYEPFTSSPFHLQQDQSLDLGTLPLTRAGIVFIKIKGQDGARIRNGYRPTVECLNGERALTCRWEGRRGFCIPTPGKVTIQVISDGFKNWRSEIDISSYEIEEVQVLLEPEPE